MTDDQGYGDLGCTGNPWIQTPCIDALAAESLRCENFHVQPLCTPTRGAIMSGRRPLRNGAWGTCWGRSILKSGQSTLPELFAAAGYRTGMFGKWHLGDNYPYRPQDRGFQHVVAHKGGGVGQVPDFWGNDYFDDTYFHNGTPVAHAGYCTDVWFAEARKFITRCKEEPFFCYIATNAPHSPYLVEPRYADPYRSVPGIQAPEFYGMIANIDENIGALRGFLEEQALSEETIFIFLTDNGTSGGCTLDDAGRVTGGYNGGMRGMKGSYYEGGHRVPFFISYPKGNIRGGRVSNELSLDIDLMPTLAELCGLDAPSDIDGSSLARIWQGECDTLGNERAHFLVYRQGTEPPAGKDSAVLTCRWRLINGQELYDIEADPAQETDVAEKHSEVVMELRGKFANWWQSIADKLPEYAPLTLGSNAENPTRLDAMDVMGDVAWQQVSVAQAMRTAGRWRVSIDQPGHYRFSLYRWPPELDLAIDQGISPEACAALTYPNPDNRAKILSPVKAHLVVSDYREEKPVHAGEKACSFEYEFKHPEETDLEARFHDRDGTTWGAYYVVVERLTG